MLKPEFYVPHALEDTQDVQDVKEVKELLKRVKDSLGIGVKKKLVINENGGEDSKLKVLCGSSGAKGIRIKQTRKSKLLNSQFIIYGKNKSITFYLQARAGQEIIIKEFLGRFIERRNQVFA